MSRIIFQKAELDDLPELYSAGRKMFSGGNSSDIAWNPENIADIFMDDTSLLIIALRDKKILGVAAGKISDRENRIVEIFWFGVLEKFSGTGLDEDLLEEFNNAAKESGIKSVRIALDPNRTKVFFPNFEKLGFVETGVIRILEKKI